MVCLLFGFVLDGADACFRLTEADVAGVITKVTSGREVVSQEEFIHVRIAYSSMLISDFHSPGLCYSERSGHVSTSIP